VSDGRDHWYRSFVAVGIDASERRARGRRLVVILMVALAVVVGALAWRLLSTRALDDRTESATAELRRLWRPVDLPELADQYASAVTDANTSGDYREAFGLFPRTEESTFSTGGFGRGGAFEGAYAVEAWGRNRCLAIRVTGPAPNRLRLRVVDRDC
jgi:hypothetical protein